MCIRDRLKGVLNTETGYKYTEYSRIILAFTALGEDVTSISGYNFLEKLSDMDNVCRQGTNGPIWALLAFDSGNYDIPKNKENKSQTTREGLITEILEKQLDDGGWDIADVEADPDMTAMALTSLAPYYTNSSDNIDEISGDLMDRIKAAVDKGINTLSSIQSESGTYSSMGGESAESSSCLLYTSKISMGYPDYESQIEILKDRQKVNPINYLDEVATRKEISDMQNSVDSVFSSNEILGYITTVSYTHLRIFCVFAGILI